MDQKKLPGITASQSKLGNREIVVKAVAKAFVPRGHLPLVRLPGLRLFGARDVMHA